MASTGSREPQEIWDDLVLQDKLVPLVQLQTQAQQVRLAPHPPLLVQLVQQAVRGLLQRFLAQLVRLVVWGPLLLVLVRLVQRAVWVQLQQFLVQLVRQGSRGLLRRFLVQLVRQAV